jgi:hypothetical protein
MTIAKICGNCRWHFDAFGEMGDEAKNCLALPYPDCTLVWSLPTAACVIPEGFSPRENISPEPLPTARDAS